MKTVLSPIAPWQHDDAHSCLFDCIAVVLAKYGHEPQLALGAAWDFYFRPGDIRREEYYYPCRQPDLARCLLPYHPVASRWHFPSDAAAGTDGVREAIRRGVPALVAVDNYYLRFRPAYLDVHAGHMIVVYGFDDAAEEMYVLDSTPPGYNGRIYVRELEAARGSGNPLEERDAFFAAAPVGHRWLELELTGAFPALNREWVTGAVAANLRRFREVPGDGAFSGASGLEAYLDDLCRRVAHGDEAALEELYVVGWAVQGATAWHARFLMAAGGRLAWRELSEVGRRVDRLVHHWTAARMTAAHGRKDPAAVAGRLRRRADMLLDDQRRTLSEMEWLVGRA